MRVDAASKLTNQVEESFTGREGWTKFYSTVPLQMKKIDLVRLQPSAMYSGLMTVEQSKHIRASHNWKSLSMFQICRSYQWSVLAAVAAVAQAAAVVQLASLRRKTTDFACATSNVDVLFD